MKVINKKPLAIVELKEYLKGVDEKSPVHSYIKKFCKTTKEKAEKIAEGIAALNNPKIKEENIIKLIDFLPEDTEDVNKIFTEVSLTEEEANAILEIVRKH